MQVTRMMKNLNSRQDYQSMGADKSSPSSYVRTKIFVGNVQESVQTNELRKIFDQYGNVVECEKIVGKDYAFVHYESAEQAERAVKSLKDYELKGKKLIVQLSTNKRPPRGAPGSDDNAASSKQLKSKIFSVKSSVNVASGSRGAAMDARMRPYPNPYERRHSKPLQQPDLAFELAQYSPPPPLGPQSVRSYNMPPGGVARYPYDDRRSNYANQRQLRDDYMAPLYDSNDLAYELVAERPRTPSPPPPPPPNDRYYNRDYYGRSGGAPVGPIPPFFQDAYAQNEPPYRRKDNNYQQQPRHDDRRSQYTGAQYPKGPRDYNSRQKQPQHDSRAPWPLSPNDLATTLMRGASPPPPYGGPFGGDRDVDPIPYQSYGGRGMANPRSGKSEEYYGRGAPGAGAYPPTRDSFSRQNDYHSRGANQERSFTGKADRHHHHSQPRNPYPSNSGKAPRNR